MKIDFGPGYRVYYTERRGELVVLLAGNPSFAAVLKVARALGLRLHAEAA